MTALRFTHYKVKDSRLYFTGTPFNALYQYNAWTLLFKKKKLHKSSNPWKWLMLENFLTHFLALLLQGLAPLQSWPDLHHYPRQPCSCTSISTKGDDSFISVGEDGSLNVVQMDRKQPTRKIGTGLDACSVYTVTHIYGACKTFLMHEILITVTLTP